MKKILLLAQLSLVLVVMAGLHQPRIRHRSPLRRSADSVYGPYPKDYKRIVGRWLETRLIDPTSATIDWLGEPKPGELPVKGGAPLRGYLVDIKVNSRNLFGAPTGKQKHTILIRDGEVIKATGF